MRVEGASWMSSGGQAVRCVRAFYKKTFKLYHVRVLTRRILKKIESFITPFKVYTWE